MELQAKLLRFLQERVVERLGGREEIPVDVRIICATHQDLEQLMTQGRFREDLYYRISEITIKIPPLRERDGDPLILAKAFLDRFSSELKRPLKGFDQGAIDAIEAYPWPGNVRELESRLKRAVIMAEGSYLSASDLELEADALEPAPLNLKEVREEAERKAVERALAQCNNKISDAAKALGVTRPTLYSILEKYGLRP
jgi:two-component system NtrC family response regulator